MTFVVVLFAIMFLSLFLMIQIQSSSLAFRRFFPQSSSIFFAMSRDLSKFSLSFFRYFFHGVSFFSSSSSFRPATCRAFLTHEHSTAPLELGYGKPEFWQMPY